MALRIAPETLGAVDSLGTAGAELDVRPSSTSLGRGGGEAGPFNVNPTISQKKRVCNFSVSRRVKAYAGEIAAVKLERLRARASELAVDILLKHRIRPNEMDAHVLSALRSRLQGGTNLILTLMEVRDDHRAA